MEYEGEVKEAALTLDEFTRAPIHSCPSWKAIKKRAHWKLPPSRF